MDFAVSCAYKRIGTIFVKGARSRSYVTWHISNPVGSDTWIIVRKDIKNRHVFVVEVTGGFGVIPRELWGNDAFQRFDIHCYW